MRTSHLAAIAAGLALASKYGVNLLAQSRYCGPHTCGKCGKKFNGARALSQHNTDAHGRRKP